jgi:hypothetical protein
MIGRRIGSPSESVFADWDGSKQRGHDPNEQTESCQAPKSETGAGFIQAHCREQCQCRKDKNRRHQGA